MPLRMCKPKKPFRCFLYLGEWELPKLLEFLGEFATVWEGRNCGVTPAGFREIELDHAYMITGGFLTIMTAKQFLSHYTLERM